jgi:hypothetical protein
MPTYRVSYSINGARNEIQWTPERGHCDAPSLAKWLMQQEFPNVPYRGGVGMEKVLRDHGITDIRTLILTA